MSDEDLIESSAKAAADALDPPVDYEMWDHKTRQFVMEHRERFADDPAFLTFIDAGGLKSIRAATFSEIVAAALPHIRAAIAAEIEAARERDRAERQAEADEGGDPHPDACDSPHWECHAAGAHLAFSVAARIARGGTAA